MRPLCVRTGTKYRLFMKKIRLILTAVIVAAVAAACGSSSTKDCIATARAAIAAGDFDLAQKTLDEIVVDIDSKSPSATELSQMAVLYMIVNDNQDENGNEASALDCFRRAVALDPDSVQACFRSLPPDESQYLFMLSSLQCGMEVDGAYLEENAVMDSADVLDDQSSTSRFDQSPAATDASDK